MNVYISLPETSGNDSFVVSYLTVFDIISFIHISKV